MMSRVSFFLFFRVLMRHFYARTTCLSSRVAETARDLTIGQPLPRYRRRVLTFNLRVRTILDGPNIWDRRRDFVVERVRSFDPDLLGTQEGWGVMEDFLRDQLDDYTFFGVGQSDGKRRGEMCAVFFKTARFDRLDGGHFWLSALTEPAEVHLAKRLTQFGEIVPQVLNDFRPNILANYLFELANAFHAFYEACPVLKADEPARATRLALCELAARTLQRGLDLLGINVPEKCSVWAR